MGRSRIGAERAVIHYMITAAPAVAWPTAATRTAGLTPTGLMCAASAAVERQRLDDVVAGPSAAARRRRRGRRRRRAPSRDPLIHFARNRNGRRYMDGVGRRTSPRVREDAVDEEHGDICRTTAAAAAAPTTTASRLRCRGMRWPTSCVCKRVAAAGRPPPHPPASVSGLQSGCRSSAPPSQSLTGALARRCIGRSDLQCAWQTGGTCGVTVAAWSMPSAVCVRD